MFTFLTIVHCLGLIAHSLVNKLRPIPRPHIKLGFALAQTSLGLPEPKLALTLSLTTTLSYKVSVPLRSLYSLWRWISSWS